MEPDAFPNAHWPLSTSMERIDSMVFSFLHDVPHGRTKKTSRRRLFLSYMHGCRSSFLRKNYEYAPLADGERDGLWQQVLATAFSDTDERLRLDKICLWDVRASLDLDATPPSPEPETRAEKMLHCLLSRRMRLLKVAPAFVHVASRDPAHVLENLCRDGIPETISN